MQNGESMPHRQIGGITTRIEEGSEEGREEGSMREDRMVPPPRGIRNYG